MLAPLPMPAILPSPHRLTVLVMAFVLSLAVGGAAQTPTNLPDPNSGPPALRLLPPVDTGSAETMPEPSPEAEAVDPVAEGLLDDGLLDDELLDEEEPVTYVWYQPAYWLGPIPWDTGIELGINGSSGTSESFSLRTGGYVKRESDLHKLALSLYYNNTSADGETTQSNALLDGRRDWLLDNSPWSLFALTQVFYDEFQAFDLNVNVNGGLGYQLVDSEPIKLGSSFGAGASREFGGPEDEWTPEAQLGFNYEQRIYDAHKFYAKVDYFPEWENFNRYRVLSDIGLEIELSRPSNVSLKLSATDRFDSDPDGVRPHNTNYSILLLWKL
ncbi:MAG: DUF481 domain-containing protein [Planctomycetota bacterium]